jgi:hypothetical protein
MGHNNYMAVCLTHCVTLWLNREASALRDAAHDITGHSMLTRYKIKAWVINHMRILCQNRLVFHSAALLCSRSKHWPSGRT